MKIESIQFMSNNQDITEQAKLIFSFNQLGQTSCQKKDLTSYLKLRKSVAVKPWQTFYFCIMILT